MYRRPDVCRLLLEYGLKPDRNHAYNESPLDLALFRPLHDSKADGEGKVIEITRLFLPICDQDVGFEHAYTLSMVRWMSPGRFEWLWMYAANVLDDVELISFRSKLLKCLVAHFPWSRDAEQNNSWHELSCKLTSSEMLQHYTRGEFKLIETLFNNYHSSFDSWTIGSRFLDLLRRWDLDVEAAVAKELADLPLLLHNYWNMDVTRKLLFEPLEGGGWRLGWEWNIHPQESGYLLVSEHIALGLDNAWQFNRWPFFDKDWVEMDEKITKRQTRFNRRTANKARKDRARTGQKRARSRMPGAWDW